MYINDKKRAGLTKNLQKFSEGNVKDAARFSLFAVR